MLNDQTSLTILLIDNTTFITLGDLTFSSLSWPVSYNGCASFEVWVPSTEENIELLKEGNVLWCKGSTAGMIEIIDEKVDENGILTLNIKGRTLEALLTIRIILGTYSALNKTKGAIMNDIVSFNCVNPMDIRRKIPYMLIDPLNANYGTQTETFQRTGNEVYSTIEEIAAGDNLGFSVNIDIISKTTTFKVFKGTDRSDEQDIVEHVILSTEMNDLLTSKYYLNVQNEKNVAFVMGEGEAADRKKVLMGETELSGFLRKELFVDASDIQSTSTNPEGVEVVLTEEQSIQALTVRGKEKLSDNKKIETFEVTIRVKGNIQYQFGVDYFVGDKVTIIDSRLGIKIGATITSAQETLSDVYSLALVIGYELPTQNQKIKKLSNS